MPSSNYIYEQGTPIQVGSHGNHKYVYGSGSPVADANKSTVVYESGSGLGGVSTGAKHRWKLNETSGTTAADSAGSLDMSHVGGPTLGVYAKEGTGYSFDGSDDGLSASGLDLGGDWAISSWSKHRGNGVIWQFSDDNGNVTKLEYVGGAVEAYVGGEKVASVRDTHYNWEFYMLVWDDAAGTARLYKADTQRGSGSPTTAFGGASNQGFAVAYDGGTAGYFNGDVDDVQMYTTHFSDSDVADLYHSYWGKKIDNFEDGGNGEYSGSYLHTVKEDEAGGPYGETQVIEGLYTGAADNNGDGREYYYSTSGLNYYPQAGDTVRWWMNYNGGSGGDESGILFGFQDTNNFYKACWVEGSNEIRIVERSGGTNTTLTSASYSVTQDVWRDCELNWESDGTMTFAVFDKTGELLAKCNTVDATYSSGGFGFTTYAAGAHDSYWDNVRTTQGTAVSSLGEIDSYEDGDMNEYTLHYGSSLGAVKRGSHTYSGAYSGQIRAGASSTALATSMPGDGLNYYPEAGDTMRVWVLQDYLYGARTAFGVQDQSNYYAVRWQEDTPGLLLEKVAGGAGTTLDSASATFSKDTYYDLRIDWQTDGTMAVEMRDKSGTVIASVTGTDTEWTTGGVGMYVRGEANGNGLHHDDWRVEDDGAVERVVDSFEDGDIAEYSGNTGGFKTTTNRATDGSYSLRGTSETIQIADTSGDLPAYPSPGDVFEYDFRIGTQYEYGSLLWAVDSESNAGHSNDSVSGYGVYTDDSTFAVRKHNSGNPNNMSKVNTGANTDEWHTIRVKWGDSGQITATLYDSNRNYVTGVSASDSEYKSGGVGWDGNDQGHGLWWDNLRILGE